MTFSLQPADFFKDKKGRVVIWQNPNLSLKVWLVSTILTHVLPYGQWNFAAALVAFGSIFTWAWLEVFQGASYFRRMAGLVVLIIIILNKLH